MKSALIRLLLSCCLVGLIAGCASYSGDFERGRTLKQTKRYFVLSNLNDNHGLDHQIAALLKDRGFEVESGPITMMPDNTQVLISYRDHWTWDFGEHLVFFQLSVQDARAPQPFGSVTFSAKVPLREDASVTVARLVDQLLAK